MKQLNNCNTVATLQGPVAATNQGNPLIKFFTRILDNIWLWQQRAQQRYHLQQLNEAMLKDIGLTRADIESEVAKPFWRA